jgi:hypothetical protein
MNVNEWMSYECSDEGTYTQNIKGSSTRSHASEEENRTRNFNCNFLLLIYVNEWMSYECSDEGTYTQNINSSSTRSMHQKKKIALEILIAIFFS